MFIKWTSIMICLIGISFPLNSRADMGTDSAVFDKDYIPALSLTSQGAVNKSKDAMRLLNQSWKIYLKLHRHDYPGDNAWITGFNEIDEWIRKADEIVDSGEKLNDAHNALEHVREILMQLRQKHKIDYYPDYLTAFHEPMEEIVLTAKGKSASTLSELDLAKIRRTLSVLDERWKEVLNARLDPKAFGFDSNHAASVKHAIELENAAIDSLKRSLGGADKAAVIQHATAIKPPFAKLYMMFGAFDEK
jgi:hypothetical protein